MDETFLTILTHAHLRFKDFELETDDMLEGESSLEDDIESSMEQVKFQDTPAHFLYMPCLAF